MEELKLIFERPTILVRIIGSYPMWSGALTDPGKSEGKHAFEGRLVNDIKEDVL